MLQLTFGILGDISTASDLYNDASTTHIALGLTHVEGSGAAE